MNKQVAKTEQVAIDATLTGSKMAPQDLGQLMAFAEVMSKADIALPQHLRGNHGACLAVALQAFEWQMSPFAVASKSYAVKGAIAYEAQLITAVVNTRSKLKGRLKADYYGKGNELTCKITGEFEDGEVREYTSPPVGAIQPKNSPLWKTDPEQQLYYYASRAWARRWCPEVILGVYDREEAEHFGPEDAKDITPSVADRLKAAKETKAEVVEPEIAIGDTGWVEKGTHYKTTYVEPMEGFDVDRVVADVVEATTMPQDEISGVASASTPEPDEVIPFSSSESAEEETSNTSSSAAPHKSLKLAAKAMFAISLTDMSKQDKMALLGTVGKQWGGSFKDAEDVDKVRSIYTSAKALIDGADRSRVLAQWGEWLNCLVEDLDEGSADG